MGRTWIRIYCDKWLEGTLREESLELRGAWADLLALAGSGKYSTTGEIKLTGNLGLTDDQLASILHTSLGTWSAIKDRLIETARIAADPDTNILTILNWNVYQPIWDKKAYMRSYMQQRRERESHEAGQELGATTQPSTDIPQVLQPGEDVPDPIAQILTALSTNYENEIGLLSASIATQLIDFAKLYQERNAPLDWIDQAFAEATSHSHRNWAYVKAILTTWMEQGRTTKSAPQVNTQEEEIEREWDKRQEEYLKANSAD